MDTKLPDNQNTLTPDINAAKFQPQPGSTANQPPSPPPEPELTPQPSTVVLPEETDGLPFWFYVLFTLVAATFFFVTFLLLKTFIEGRNQNNSLVPTSISENAEVIEPSLTPTPVDQYLESLNTLSESDEISAIETDLNATDTTQLDADLQQLNTLANPETF